MAHHMEARYDEHDGMFLPPQRTLGFNPQLKLNDSLLAQSYVEAYDISYPEALRRIEDEVAELKQHLDNEGFYEMNDIGRLSFNPEGKLEFSPCEAGILTPELYGLSSFEFTPLAQAAEEIALQQPTLVAEAPAKEASPSVGTMEGASPTYCIVAASHVSKKGADEFVQKLQNQGYTSARVHIYKNVRRVVFGNFTTEAEAYSQLHKVHQNHDLAEAWVYEVKE